MIQHQEEVLMATHRLRELIGARRAVKLLRLIWDPEQGWSTADQVSASECYIAGESCKPTDYLHMCMPCSSKQSSVVLTA